MAQGAAGERRRAAALRRRPGRNAPAPAGPITPREAALAGPSADMEALRRPSALPSLVGADLGARALFTSPQSLLGAARAVGEGARITGLEVIDRWRGKQLSDKLADRRRFS